jgi:hypothetical protein
MKTFVPVFPFLAIRERWPAQQKPRELSQAIPPRPPKPQESRDESDEPRREYPFWTYFTDNPRPNAKVLIDEASGPRVDRPRQL